MKKFDFNKYCLDRLFTEIPEIHSIGGELKQILDEYLAEGPRAHLVYEDILSYFILNLLNKDYLIPQEKELIKKLFKLIEELATHEDHEVRCVAEVSLIEPLLDKMNPIEKLINHLLPKSLELAKEVGKFRFGFNTDNWGKLPKKGAGLVYEKIY